MRALGAKNLPETLLLDGVAWTLTRTHKHDFWAVTGFYESPSGEKAVLKMGRTEPFAGVPLAWIGRWLCRREVRFYTRLADLPNVPKILGRVGETGFLHDFAPGAPLSKHRPVPDGFFDELIHLMQELHARHIAYVDANKPENILLGDDGRPHLIDFQISWDLHELGDTFLNRWWLKRLQRADVYHVLKHKKRLRADELTETERRIVTQRSAFIRIHRFITKPYFKLRRTTFKRLRASGRLLPEGSK
jgi:RIO-like serine/threonine protein kinase